MDYEAFHVGYVCEQRENLERVDKFPCLLLSAFYLDGENASAAVGKIFLVEGVVGMAGQRRMIDLGHLRMLAQIVDNLEGVFYVTFYAQRQRFQTLQQNECVERRNCGAGVAEDDGADACHESSLARYVGEDCAVVTWVGLGECWELVGIGFPVESAAVYDHTSETRAVASDKLSGGMHHNVGTVFDWADEIWGAECVVDNQRNIVAVCHFRDGFDIGDVGVGIAECLRIDNFGVGLDGSLKCFEVVDVDNGVGDALSASVWVIRLNDPP